LPPLVIADEWVARVRSEMKELPSVMAARFESQYGLSAYDCNFLTLSQKQAQYFEDGAKHCSNYKLLANWILNAVSARVNERSNEGFNQVRVSSAQLAALINRIADGTISNNAAKQVFEEIWAEGEMFTTTAMNDPKTYVDGIIEAKGLKQMSDTGELEAIIDTVLASNAKSVEEYKAGNAKAFNALVGQAMKATKGKGNPVQVNELLKKKLD
jgi:aspartyl-tRNA(Asn)/glutamyl-tRNA(Gln) amidotransferase subunit B